VPLAEQNQYSLCDTTHKVVGKKRRWKRGEEWHIADRGRVGQVEGDIAELSGADRGDIGRGRREVRVEVTLTARYPPFMM